MRMATGKPIVAAAALATVGSTMLQRMTYSKFSHVRGADAIQALDGATLEPYPFVPASQFRIVTLVDEPATQVVLEDWFKDNDIEWVYWLDAVHVVVSGTAQVSYRNPPDWETWHTVEVGPGDVYLTPRGAHVRWHITSEAPFRHLVMDIPNGGYATPSLAGAAD
jgi:mannose-6-phosphate isomerase-like protein (cupin superfamily)